MMTQALLSIVGLLIAIYGILEATSIPDEAPVSFGLEAALTCAAGIGAVVFALISDTNKSSGFVLGALILQAVYVLDAKRRGYRVCGVVVTEFKAR